ncbi:MAG: isoamylase early set domain-containing protein [Bacteroidales bacterium]
MRKAFSKTKPECKVTFKIPADILAGAKKAAVAGEFNNWNPEANPVRIVKGEGSVSIPLETGQSYQYKFIVDNDRWENDPDADSYIANEFGEANSIVKCVKKK